MTADLPAGAASVASWEDPLRKHQEPELGDGEEEYEDEDEDEEEDEDEIPLAISAQKLQESASMQQQKQQQLQQLQPEQVSTNDNTTVIQGSSAHEKVVTTNSTGALMSPAGAVDQSTFPNKETIDIKTSSGSIVETIPSEHDAFSFSESIQHYRTEQQENLHQQPTITPAAGSGYGPLNLPPPITLDSYTSIILKPSSASDSSSQLTPFSDSAHSSSDDGKRNKFLSVLRPLWKRDTGKKTSKTEDTESIPPETRKKRGLKLFSRPSLPPPSAFSPPPSSNTPSDVKPTISATIATSTTTTGTTVQAPFTVSNPSTAFSSTSSSSALLPTFQTPTLQTAMTAVNSAVKEGGVFASATAVSLPRNAERANAGVKVPIRTRAVSMDIAGGRNSSSSFTFSGATNAGAGQGSSSASSTPTTTSGVLNLFSRGKRRQSAMGKNVFVPNVADEVTQQPQEEVKEQAVEEVVPEVQQDLAVQSVLTVKAVAKIEEKPQGVEEGPLLKKTAAQSMPSFSKAALSKLSQDLPNFYQLDQADELIITSSKSTSALASTATVQRSPSSPISRPKKPILIPDAPLMMRSPVLHTSDLIPSSRTQTGYGTPTREIEMSASIASSSAASFYSFESGDGTDSSGLEFGADRGDTITRNGAFGVEERQLDSESEEEEEEPTLEGEVLSEVEEGHVVRGPGAAIAGRDSESDEDEEGKGGITPKMGPVKASEGLLEELDGKAWALSGPDEVVIARAATRGERLQEDEVMLEAFVDGDVMTLPVEIEVVDHDDEMHHLHPQNDASVVPVTDRISPEAAAVEDLKRNLLAGSGRIGTAPPPNSPAGGYVKDAVSEHGDGVVVAAIAAVAAHVEASSPASSASSRDEALNGIGVGLGERDLTVKGVKEDSVVVVAKKPDDAGSSSNKVPDLIKAFEAKAGSAGVPMSRPRSGIALDESEKDAAGIVSSLLTSPSVEVKKAAAAAETAPHSFEIKKSSFDGMTLAAHMPRSVSPTPQLPLSPQLLRRRSTASNMTGTLSEDDDLESDITSLGDVKEFERIIEDATKNMTVDLNPYPSDLHMFPVMETLEEEEEEDEELLEEEDEDDLIEEEEEEMDEEDDVVGTARSGNVVGIGLGSMGLPTVVVDTVEDAVFEGEEEEEEEEEEEDSADDGLSVEEDSVDMEDDQQLTPLEGRRLEDFDGYYHDDDEEEEEEDEDEEDMINIVPSMTRQMNMLDSPTRSCVVEAPGAAARALGLLNGVDEKDTVEEDESLEEPAANTSAFFVGEEMQRQKSKERVVSPLFSFRRKVPEEGSSNGNGNGSTSPVFENGSLSTRSMSARGGESPKKSAEFGASMGRRSMSGRVESPLSGASTMIPPGGHEMMRQPSKERGSALSLFSFRKKAPDDVTGEVETVSPPLPPVPIVTPETLALAAAPGVAAAAAKAAAAAARAREEAVEAAGDGVLPPLVVSPPLPAVPTVAGAALAAPVIMEDAAASMSLSLSSMSSSSDLAVQKGVELVPMVEVNGIRAAPESSTTTVEAVEVPIEGPVPPPLFKEGGRQVFTKEEARRKAHALLLREPYNFYGGSVSAPLVSPPVSPTPASASGDASETAALTTPTPSAAVHKDLDVSPARTLEMMSAPVMSVNADVEMLPVQEHSVAFPLEGEEELKIPTTARRTPNRRSAFGSYTWSGVKKAGSTSMDRKGKSAAGGDETLERGDGTVKRQNKFVAWLKRIADKFTKRGGSGGSGGDDGKMKRAMSEKGMGSPSTRSVEVVEPEKPEEVDMEVLDEDDKPLAVLAKIGAVEDANKPDAGAQDAGSKASGSVPRSLSVKIADRKSESLEGVGRRSTVPNPMAFIRTATAKRTSTSLQRPGTPSESAGQGSSGNLSPTETRVPTLEKSLTSPSIASRNSESSATSASKNKKLKNKESRSNLSGRHSIGASKQSFTSTESNSMSPSYLSLPPLDFVVDPMNPGAIPRVSMAIEEARAMKAAAAAAAAASEKASSPATTPSTKTAKGEGKQVVGVLKRSVDSDDDKDGDVGGLLGLAIPREWRNSNSVVSSGAGSRQILGAKGVDGSSSTASRGSTVSSSGVGSRSRLTIPSRVASKRDTMLSQMASSSASMISSTDGSSIRPLNPLARSGTLSREAGLIRGASTRSVRFPTFVSTDLERLYKDVCDSSKSLADLAALYNKRDEEELVHSLLEGVVGEDADDARSIVESVLTAKSGGKISRPASPISHASTPSYGMVGAHGVFRSHSNAASFVSSVKPSKTSSIVDMPQPQQISLPWARRGLLMKEPVVVTVRPPNTAGVGRSSSLSRRRSQASSTGSLLSGAVGALDRSRIYGRRDGSPTLTASDVSNDDAMLGLKFLDAMN
ncbi:hypothetical protein HDU97_002916 [Phlyctochytrium planicorne]|nr:hypothetical protein HDU97_002916 [Phlyctochytrium planicorne]